MKQKLLLLSDVDDLGKKGEIVDVAPGYARNFLLPQKLAIIATKETVKMQERLRKERAEKAVLDKKESEELAKVLEKTTLSVDVKVDPEGKMYGSVSAQDIVNLLKEKEISLDRKNIQLKHPIKETGSYSVSIKLKEGVLAACKLEINPEGKIAIAKVEENQAEVAEEKKVPTEDQQPIDEEEK